MSKVMCDISVSVDGYAAAPNQSLERPFGDWVGERLHRWMFEEGEAEANAEVIERIVAAKAFVMGRNMFSPGRGEHDPEWHGWWGEEPPYHGPVFVLSHYERDPIPMKGGTTFHFVTDGIESALAQAREAAGDGDISICGGAQTVNQYLAANLLDELRLHIAPIVLGAGTRLFDGVEKVELEQVETSATKLVTHITYHRSAGTAS